jgi:KRAB domain-containing zinc finger protein
MYQFIPGENHMNAQLVIQYMFHTDCWFTESWANSYREQPYEYSTCQRCFTWMSSLRYHEWTHTGEQPLMLNMSETFYTAWAFTNSCENSHKGNCTWMLKFFTEFVKLPRHELTNIGERPYEHSICQRRIRLVIYMIICLTLTEERPYKCSRCQSCFTQIVDLWTNEWTHTRERP